MNFIAMDYETAAGQRASACSVAIVVVRDNQVVDSFYNLINPEVPFSPYNQRVHHITPEMVADAPTWPEIWPHIASFFTADQLVVAHNAGFDVSVVRKSLERYRIPAVQFQYIDTVTTTRALYPGWENYKLNTVSSQLGIPLEHHHNALVDAYACAQVLLTEANQFNETKLRPYIKMA